MQDLEDELDRYRQRIDKLSDELDETKIDEMRQNKLISSSFFNLGLNQMRNHSKQNPGLTGNWLESQKGHIYNHAYDEIFKAASTNNSSNENAIRRSNTYQSPNTVPHIPQVRGSKGRQNNF